MSRPIIYLAPSSQQANIGLYRLYDTNEAEMCNKITNYIVKELAKYNVTVHRGGITTGLNENARRANELKCQSYYAIHTNASSSPSADGVTAIYQSSVQLPLSRRIKSKKMATNLTYAIASMGRDNRGIFTKRNSWGGEYFSDLRQPNMPSTILEIEFHTNPDATKWIVNNPITIGRKIAQAIAKTENLWKFYTVQIATASLNVRSNAGVQYTKVGVVHSPNKYKVYAEKKDNKGYTWIYIQYATGKFGWCAKNYTKTVA